MSRDVAAPEGTEHQAPLNETSLGAFGSLLREYRVAAGLSQERLAERARISVDAVSALERGTRSLPQRNTLTLLIEALALKGDARRHFEASAVRPSRPRRSQPQVEQKRAGERTLPHNAAHPLTSFIERNELSDLTGLVSRTRLVTIVGTGGAGKTRMALEVGTSLADRYRDGVWFVDLAALRAPLVLQELASVMRIRERPGSALRDLVISELAPKELLLIVDNCEHVVDEAALVIETLLSHCQNVTVLATSRESLRAAGEHVFRLPSLAVPPEDSALDAGAALTYSAIALFVERASAADPDFTLTDRNVATVAAICRHLDGIPFALELAAAKIGLLSPKAILEGLDQRFHLLTDGRRTALPRQQTLRASIEWSYVLLSNEEQTLLRRIAIFPRSFNLEAAVAVGAGGVIDARAAADLLSSLTAKSLAVVEAPFDEDGRFRLLESTREFALEHLERVGERESIAARHVDYVLEFARRAAATLPNASEPEWLDMVAGAIDDVRAALEWALGEEKAVVAGAEIVGALGFFWHSRRYQEGTRWLEIARRHVGSLEPRLAGHVLLESVRSQTAAQGDLDLAERAVQAYRDAGDLDGLRRSLEYLGQSLINAGKYAVAAETLSESLELASRLDVEASTSRTLALLGYALLYAGNPNAARDRFERSRQLARAARRDRTEAEATRGLSEVSLWIGDPESAVRLANEALRIFEALDDLRGAEIQRYFLAHALLEAGKPEEAWRQASSAIRALGSAGLPLALFEAILVGAAILERLGDIRAAQILGFLEAAEPGLAPLTMIPPFRNLSERTRGSLDSQLGAAEVRRKMAEGATLDQHSVVRDLGGE
jgi:predicted ATPase/DNA-binding XRE family transcriptional regulator